MNYAVSPNSMNAQQIAHAVQRGAEQYDPAHQLFSQGTSSHSSVTESDYFAEGPLYNWPDVIPDSLYVAQPKSATKPNEINLISSSVVASSTADPFDYEEESPSKISGGRTKMPEGLMRLLGLSYTFYLLKGTDMSKASSTSRTKKPVYTSIPLPPAKILFDINLYKWHSLKNQLFLLSSEIDNTDDELQGNAAILKAADASNKVVIMGYIHKHDSYAKTHKRVLNSDETLENFYKAVKGSPGTEAGFTIIMENPTKAAQEAEISLTKKQGRLRAQNHIENVPTTSSDLARLAPVDRKKEFLTSLQVQLGSFKNHNNEGWRIFNKDDLSQKMELTFSHLLLWARELAAGTAGVTLDIPPQLPEFIWKDIKRPLHAPSPVQEPKRAKVLINEQTLPFKIGSYAEMQGTNINIDFDTLQRILPYTSLVEYLKYCDFDADPIEGILSILLANRIPNFHCFLFPDVLNAKIIESWGICWGSAIELMTHPCRFYELQVQADERRRSKGKGRMIVLDSE